MDTSSKTELTTEPGTRAAGGRHGEVLFSVSPWFKSPIYGSPRIVTPTPRSSLVRVTERETGFFCDLEDLLARLVPVDLAARERLIVMLLGPRTEHVPFSDGRLCLGTWQRVLFFGFNGDPRAEWTLTVVGETLALRSTDPTGPLPVR